MNEWFVFLPSDVVHPHDQFLDRCGLCWLPNFITPNILTTIRVVCTPLVFWLIYSGQYAIGAAAFFFVAFTDAMDGSLARTRNQITRFGMLYDPLADKLLIGSLVALLVFRYFHPALGIIILTLEAVFIISALVIRLRFKTVKMANLWGKIKMICQCLATFLTILAILFEFPLLFSIAAWVFGLAIGFAILSLFRSGV